MRPAPATSVRLALPVLAAVALAAAVQPGCTDAAAIPPVTSAPVEGTALTDLETTGEDAPPPRRAVHPSRLRRPPNWPPFMDEGAPTLD